MLYHRSALGQSHKISSYWVRAVMGILRTSGFPVLRQAMPPSGARLPIQSRHAAGGGAAEEGLALPTLDAQPPQNDQVVGLALQREVRVVAPRGGVVRGNGRRHCGPRSPADGPGPRPAGRGRAAAVDAPGPARPSGPPPAGTGSGRAVFLRASWPCRRKKCRSRHRVAWRCQPCQLRPS